MSSMRDSTTSGSLDVQRQSLLGRSIWIIRRQALLLPAMDLQTASYEKLVGDLDERIA